MAEKIKAVVIGAGARGAGVYINRARPGDLEVVGVAEPHEGRRNQIKEKYGLSDDVCFESYEQLFEKERFADLAIIATNDRMHVIPSEMAVKKGYHILLEKPISPVPEEVYKIGQLAASYDKEFSICHVLRYTPFFKTLKKLLDDGRIGKLISVTHNENVGYWHMAHSFVRGNWRNSVETSPMILAKCCHDMDILLYLIGADCKKISSFGGLTHFKEENKPEGAPKRCVEGCPVFDTCQFNAVKLYTESGLRGWIPKVFNLDDVTDENIVKALYKNPYGRCVYQCDNNVVDHQVVNMVFENDVTVAFTMCAFTLNNERVFRFMGVDGEIEANMEKREIICKDFKTGNIETIVIPESVSGHGGGDAGIMNSIINAIRGNGSDKSSASTSVQSHMMAFAAEKARVEGTVVDLDEFVSEVAKNVK